MPSDDRQITRPIEAEDTERFLASYKLPCDVRLPPATIIRKGCPLSTLLCAMEARRGMGLDWGSDDR